MGDIEDRPRGHGTGDLEVGREGHRSPPDGTGRRAAETVADPAGAECRSNGACLSAARMRWLSRSALVRGPTPPGTGVMAEATWTALSKSTSPTRRPSTTLIPT